MQLLELDLYEATNRLSQIQPTLSSTSIGFYHRAELDCLFHI